MSSSTPVESRRPDFISDASSDSSVPSLRKKVVRRNCRRGFLISIHLENGASPPAHPTEDATLVGERATIPQNILIGTYLSRGEAHVRAHHPSGRVAERSGSQVQHLGRRAGEGQQHPGPEPHPGGS